MRIFAAVLPPEAAVEELAAEVAELKRLPEAEGLRWTGQAGWHFTVAFYGEVGEEVLPKLHERLGRAARRREPFPLRLKGGGHFGDRALWAGAEGDLVAMRRLADGAAAGARRAGVAMEEHRGYVPHLTLARSRTRGRTGASAQAPTLGLAPFVDALAGFEGRRWTVGELALVRSRLPVAGVPREQPRYETVAAWPLGG